MPPGTRIRGNNHLFKRLAALTLALVGAAALATAAPATAATDPFQITHLGATPTTGPYPLPVTLTATVDNPLSTQVSYSFDFGDGSAPVPSDKPVAQHTYDRASPNQPDGPSSFTARVTATLPDGETRSAVTFVRVVEPGPTVANLHATQVGPLTVGADAFYSTDSWPITGYDFDYGDGSPAVKGDSSVGGHTYAAPGTYTITLTIHDGHGGSATATRQISVAGAYIAAGPQRLLDTRDGAGPLGAGGQTSVQVTGANGVPAGGVSAVVLNVTATDATADSFLTVYPSGSPNPGTSNLNFTAGQTVPNLVTAPVGPDGKVVIANHAGSADVVVDLEGYYQSSPAAATGSFLDSVQPHRVADTRDGTRVPRQPVGANQNMYLALGDDVPANTAPGNATAVVLNVTVTNPTADSFLTVYRDGAATPTASNLNYRAGQTVSNLVIVPLSDRGVIAFYNHAGSADVIADVQGYFIASPGNWGPTTSFTPVAPSRMLDTRDGTGGFHAPVGSNASIGLPMAGVGSVPAYAKSVVLNVTVVDGTANSLLTVYPGVLSATSNLNFGPGQIKQVQVMVPIGPDGKVDFYNGVGSVDVIADVFGYFA